MKNNKPEGGQWSYDRENRLPFKDDYREKEIKIFRKESFFL